MRYLLKKIALAAVVCLVMAPSGLLGQTVGGVIERQLGDAGIDAKTSSGIVKGVERKAGISLNVPLYDRVDFDTFPDARVSVQKLGMPAALVLTPQFSSYVFRGKPETFQGSFRTYEFNLGEGARKACSMIFPQVFERIRGVSDVGGVAPNEIAIVPKLDEFKFSWGGTWTLVMSVSLKMTVAVYAAGNLVSERSYSVENVNEGTSTVFPNERQEYKAISKAMISVLTQAAQELATLPALLAYKAPAPVVEESQPVASKKIDMDAIIFLADTWERYRENVGRLTPDERLVARRILRLKDAQAHRDVDRQQDEINFLLQVAKKMEPVSRADLLGELKRQKSWTDQEVDARNAAEDRIFNFAGDSTDTVLDYAGLGIDLAKVGVLATGCVMSASTLCPALALTMAQFDAVSTVAEGVGAASEELIWKSGDLSTAVFQGAKASLVDYAAGKVGGGVADATVGKLAAKVSRATAVSAARSVQKAGLASPALANRVVDNVFVTTMELSSRAPVAALSALVKDGSKRLVTQVENMAVGRKAAVNSLKPPAGNARPELQFPDPDSLMVLQGVAQ